MSGYKTIVQKNIMLGSLVLSVSALPFSVKLCHLGLIILVINWMLEGDWKTKRSLLNQSMLLHVIAGYLLLELSGLILAHDLAAGWFSLEKKIFLFILPFCLATTSTRLSPREVKSIFAIFVAACFLGSLFCLQHAWQESRLVMLGEHAVEPYLAGSQFSLLHPAVSEAWLVFSYASLSKGINIHPTYFSAFLVFGVVFLLHEFPSLRQRRQQVVALLLVAWFSLFTIFLASRIITIALIVVLVVATVRSVSRKQGSLAAITIILTIVVSTLLVINPVSRYRSFEEISRASLQVQPGVNYTTSTQIRYSLWWLSVKTLQTWNPVTGLGTGNTQKAMETTADSFKITNSIQSSDPHNQFLYSLLTHGVPGLLLLLLILGLPLVFAWNQRHLMVLAFGFLFCLLCVTESALEVQKGIAFYAIISGLLLFQLNTYQTAGVNLKFLLRVNQ